MIKHSEALSAWETIFTEGTLPFNDILKNGGSYLSITNLYSYFLVLKKDHAAGNFHVIKRIFFEFAQHVPFSVINHEYRLLLDYFSQLENYTPINKKTGRRLFRAWSVKLPL